MWRVFYWQQQKCWRSHQDLASLSERGYQLYRESLPEYEVIEVDAMMQGMMHACSISKHHFGCAQDVVSHAKKHNMNSFDANACQQLNLWWNSICMRGDER